MLLQKLVEFEADGFEAPPPMYALKPVRYLVDLDSDGSLLNLTPIDTSDPDDRRTRRGFMRMVPSVVRSNTVRPLLLADNAEYTLGAAREGSRSERVSAMHDAYRELVDRSAGETGLPSVSAVASFLRDDPLSRLDLGDDFDRTATITFRVDGEFPVDDPKVREFWADAAHKSESRSMQCVICGRSKPVLDRLQKKVKGIPGGQMSGTSIISANSDVFESYGLKNSQIAPTCAECGERFTESLNYLLSTEAHHIRTQAAKCVYWTRGAASPPIGKLVTAPNEQDVKEYYKSLWSGGRVAEPDDASFYGAVLSASGGRAVLRDWIDTTVGQVRQHLREWFEAQRIVDPSSNSYPPLGLNALLGATVRDLRDVSPPTVRSLLRCALTGAPAPMDLLYQAVRRNRAEQRVTRPRAALVKLVFATNDRDKYKEGYMTELESTNQDPAYLCGQLLHVLENIQYAAIPGINSTVVDRYFGTASAAPASVFSRLLRGAQPHLSKLKRDNPGAYWANEERLAEIQENLTEFPKTLTLEQQGLFALGYYHQRARQFREIRERRERAD